MSTSFGETGKKVLLKVCLILFLFSYLKVYSLVKTSAKTSLCSRTLSASIRAKSFGIVERTSVLNYC